jgi:hypothetical protein
VAVYLAWVHPRGPPTEQPADCLGNPTEKSADLPEQSHNWRRLFAHGDLHRLNLMMRNASRSARRLLLWFLTRGHTTVLVNHVDELLPFKFLIPFGIISAVTHEPASSKNRFVSKAV